RATLVLQKLANHPDSPLSLNTIFPGRPCRTIAPISEHFLTSIASCSFDSPVAIAAEPKKEPAKQTVVRTSVRFALACGDQLSLLFTLMNTLERFPPMASSAMMHPTAMSATINPYSV